MESYLVASAFFLMVFTPAIVGARNSARENRLREAGEQAERPLRLRPSLSRWTARRWRNRPAAPLAIEDPLQALELDSASAEELASAVAAAPAQSAVYVKNYTFDISRFNQPERQQSDGLGSFGASAHPAAESALATLAEPVSAPEAADEANVSYGDPEPLYVRRAVYGRQESHVTHVAHGREEMPAPYPYAPAYPNPYAAAYPMISAMNPMAAMSAMNPMAGGYPSAPQHMAPQMPNPYFYPYAFAPVFPFPGFPPYAMGYPQFMGYPMPAPQFPTAQPLGPQLVEPYGSAQQTGYPQNQARWEHRSAVPYRSLYRRA